MNFSLFSFLLRRRYLLPSCQTVPSPVDKPDSYDLVLNAAVDLTRSKPELILENMLLRQQLIVLKRQVRRPALMKRDRVLFVLLASLLRTWKRTRTRLLRAALSIIAWRPTKNGLWNLT